MRTIFHRALIMTLLPLAACGQESWEGSGGDAPDAPQLKLASGLYNLSEVTFQEDGCMLSNLPTPLAVWIQGDTITFTDLGEANLPTGTFSGAQFTARADYVYDNSEDEYAIDCREHLTKEVEGVIDGVNTFEGRFRYASEVQSGNECTPEWLGYPVPCRSVASFRATRVP